MALTTGTPGPTAYLTFDEPAAAIDFYVTVFGAEEICRLNMGAEGQIGHAELRIGAGALMLASAFPEMGIVSPAMLGGSPVMMQLYVDNVDAVCASAVQNGAAIEKPIEDQFHGDRTGQIKDPFGYRWTISTAKETITPEELMRRWQAMMTQSQ